MPPNTCSDSGCVSVWLGFHTLMKGRRNALENYIYMTEEKPSQHLPLKWKAIARRLLIKEEIKKLLLFIVIQLLLVINKKQYLFFPLVWTEMNPKTNDHNTVYGFLYQLFPFFHSILASDSLQAPCGGRLGFRCCTQARSQNHQQACSENGRRECCTSHNHSFAQFCKHLFQLF